MPHERIDAEKGPKGTRCVVRMDWTGRSPRKPYLRPRTWKSSWFNTGNEQRDFYLARLEMQKRIADAVAAGTFPW